MRTATPERLIYFKRKKVVQSVSQSVGRSEVELASSRFPSPSSVAVHKRRPQSRSGEGIGRRAAVVGGHSQIEPIVFARGRERTREDSDEGRATRSPI